MESTICGVSANVCRVDGAVDAATTVLAVERDPANVAGSSTPPQSDAGAVRERDGS
jgi:hypothetical protein